MEISLNTSGYKPSELKVNVSDGEISIEGKHEVVSNLSQDGVMVITVPKEKKIQEVKEEKKMNVEHRSSSSKNQSLIPMTMRDSFFDDRFFKDTWMDIETSQKDFFVKSRKRFKESMKHIESDMMSTNIFDEYKNPLQSSSWIFPEMFGGNNEPVFSFKDGNQIRIVDDDTKLEISLDTTGYKPDELKVSAGQGMICVEGKHEEKCEAGQVMVSRQFSKKYSMPSSARAEEVVSDLSQDGVLVISIPKREAIKQENRAVPIAVK